ncbi:MAG: FISUMP domain-containing protein [Bacteroidota bacterium]
MKLPFILILSGLLFGGILVLANIDSAQTDLQPSLGEKKADSFVDKRDQERYAYIKLGGLYWMKENLRYEAVSSECYKGEAENCEAYGRLYAHSDISTACPEGWRLPTTADWKALKKTIKSKKADRIIAEGIWEGEAFEGANNELGLSILPGGRKDELGPPDRESPFGEMGISASFWLDETEDHWHVRWGKNQVHRHGDISKQGRKFSIRCVCENPE